jgi:cell division protein FtsQ
MNIPFRKRPAKRAAGHRSNQWRGPRAMQVADQKQQARRSQLVARCRRALRISGWIVGAAAVLWIGGLASRELGPVVQRGLEIRDVLVEGGHQVTKQDVLDRLALKKGLALHQVSLSYLAARLQAHPWIKEATVERLPLHELRVTIVERKPAAIARIGSEQQLIDEEGVVLARLGARDEPTLPLLMGIDGSALAQGDMRLKQQVQSSIALAKRMAQLLDGRIEIDLARPQNLVASAKNARFHFGSDGLLEQWERFMTVKAASRMPVLDAKKHEGHEVDLRYDNRVILRERG